MNNSQDKPNVVQALNDAALIFAATIQQINKIWVDAVNIFQEQFEQRINKIRVDAFKAFQEHFEQIRHAIQQMPSMEEKALKAGKKALNMLGQHGWYISMNMPASVPIEIAKKIIDGQIDDVNRLMCDYFEKNWQDLKEDIIEMCPLRSVLLDRAFEAHKRGEYELSIPVFLAQADGICKQLAGYQLFRKKEGVPTTSKFVEQFTSDSYMMALLEPFRSPMPISASEKERQVMHVPFNRHQIIHGEVVDYGTRVNSCRAISLVSYVCSVLKIAIKQKNLVSE